MWSHRVVVRVEVGHHHEGVVVVLIDHPFADCFLYFLIIL
jgi:hypothetical protein